jgi:predicted CxxxxCH...CXXCH cytochrome family protein
MSTHGNRPCLRSRRAALCALLLAIAACAERRAVDDAGPGSEGVHGPSVLDPCARGWHGRLATVDRAAPLTDPDHVDACGRCHRGAPAAGTNAGFAVPGATACTECHDEPGDALACATCHGPGTSVYPARAACDGGARDDAHRAHRGESAIGPLALACSACHPQADASLTGTHADGRVDVRLDPELTGPDAQFDTESKRCAVGCHLPSSPDWFAQGPLGCGDCHDSPPADHPPGACSQCHAEANDDGTALRAAVLHMNGRVDLGGGGQTCGACHGDGDDPWPRSGLHALHRDTPLTEPIACGDCHAVPDGVTDEGHLDPAPAEVVLGGRAADRGRAPSYEDLRCADVACHAAGLASALAPATARWDSEPTRQCAACHEIPPRAGHPEDDNCASLICHGAEIAPSPEGPRISAAGRALHIDGKLDALSPTAPR